MPADDGVGLDEGQVTPPFGEIPGEESPKCPVCGPESRPLGVSLQNLELMSKGDVLQGELLAGFERCVQGKKNDFEHPIMLNSGTHNRNDTNADGIFGRNKAQCLLGYWLSPKKVPPGALFISEKRRIQVHLYIVGGMKPGPAGRNDTSGLQRAP